MAVRVAMERWAAAGGTGDPGLRIETTTTIGCGRALWTGYVYGGGNSYRFTI
jgi:hypothetical protein